MYGMGADALAEELHIPPQRATTLMKRFNAAFPSFEIFRKGLIRKARERGYVETLGGYRRYVFQAENRQQHLMCV